MKGLQLVGYTADLHHLVVDEGDGGARFRVPVDEDLVATLQEVIERLPDDHPLAGALDRGDATSSPSDADDPREHEDRVSAHGAAPVVVDDEGDPVEPGAPGAARSRRSGGLAGAAVLAVRARDAARTDASGTGRRSSLLSPREIQVLLRAGVGTGLVAQRAQTDEDWVRRWLPPIAAERERVLAQAFTARVSSPTKAPPSPVLGDSVRDHLRSAGSDPDGDDVEWQVTRREADTSWTVTLRHDGRDGRAERARWRFDPDSRRLDALDDRARDLGGVTAAPPAALSQGAVPPAAPSAGPPRAATRPTAPPKAAAPPRAAEPAASPPPPERRRPARPAPAPTVDDGPRPGPVASDTAAPAPADAPATPGGATPRGDRRQRRRTTGGPAPDDTAAADGGGAAPRGPAAGGTAAATPRRRRPRGPAPR